jgi:hypothetical protein
MIGQRRFDVLKNMVFLAISLVWVTWVAFAQDPAKPSHVRTHLLGGGIVISSVCDMRE